MQPSSGGKLAGGPRRLADGPRPSLEMVTAAAKKLPSRMVVHAIPKWGKTSFASQAPEPIVIMTRGEDGLLTLIDSGQLPPTPHFPEPCETWGDLLTCLNELLVKQHTRKTVIIDTMNGAERLCHEHVMATECDGSAEKFHAYGRGPQLALVEVIRLTTLLDRLREKGMAVILIAHSQVKRFQNPDGPDYDRWEPVLSKETWAHIDRWADLILFGCYEVVVEQKDKRARGKAKGGQTRLLMCERAAAYDAGNRVGLPQEIECGASAEEAWANFRGALRSGKEQ